jgi:hypothetical protein
VTVGKFRTIRYRVLVIPILPKRSTNVFSTTNSITHISVRRPGCLPTIACRQAAYPGRYRGDCQEGECGKRCIYLVICAAPVADQNGGQRTGTASLCFQVTNVCISRWHEPVRYSRGSQACHKHLIEQPTACRDRLLATSNMTLFQWFLLRYTQLPIPSLLSG